MLFCIFVADPHGNHVIEVPENEEDVSLVYITQLSDLLTNWFDDTY
jgi:hypothetical protein